MPPLTFFVSFLGQAKKEKDKTDNKYADQLGITRKHKNVGIRCQQAGKLFSFTFVYLLHILYF